MKSVFCTLCIYIIFKLPKLNTKCVSSLIRQIYPLYTVYNDQQKNIQARYKTPIMLNQTEILFVELVMHIRLPEKFKGIISTVTMNTGNKFCHGIYANVSPIFSSMGIIVQIATGLRISANVRTWKYSGFPVIS